MGSIVDDRKEFTVLVTGFGPFREQYPVNPSWEIAKSLPAYLPALRAKDVQARASTDVMGFPASGSEGVRPLPAVRIVVKPAEAIRVNYRVTRAVVPTLWDGDEREPDAVIHLGMGPTQPVYSIERRAHRTGYRTPDVDGELPEGENEAERDGNWIWYGCPDELDTDLDMGRILTQWRRISPGQKAGLDLRMSDDPGRYLCDFIYYSSLAHLWKQQRRRRVTFLHVPVDASPRAVDLGRELVLNLVRCVAESELSRGSSPEEARVV